MFSDLLVQLNLVRTSSARVRCLHRGMAGNDLNLVIVTASRSRSRAGLPITNPSTLQQRQCSEQDVHRPQSNLNAFASGYNLRAVIAI